MKHQNSSLTRILLVLRKVLAAVTFGTHSPSVEMLVTSLGRTQQRDGVGNRRDDVRYVAR